MSYLLDKKIKKKKIIKISALVVLLFLAFYFRSGILKGISHGAHFIARPFLAIGGNIGHGFGNLGIYFSSKKLLTLENENLKAKLAFEMGQVSNYNSILDENTKLKEILNRKKTGNDLILAAVLNRPNRSIYDTFIVDVGSNNEITVDQKVFALGNVPIGRVAEVYTNSSLVVLYSSPGEKTEVAISGKDVFMEAVGRGGGNFEMVLPRDFTVDPGAEVVLPGITPYVMAKVVTIISDPRDSFQKALLSSVINVFELKTVEVAK